MTPTNGTIKLKKANVIVAQNNESGAGPGKAIKIKKVASKQITKEDYSDLMTEEARYN